MNHLKILIVEDDPLLVNLYETAFRAAGYDVLTAFDGEAGLKKLREAEKKPTLVLSDVMMPKMDGLDMLEKIKADPALKSIPVVLLTNLGGGEDVNRGLSLGAVTYLVKSQYLPREIVGKVREIITAYGHEEVPEVRGAVKDIPDKNPDSAKN